MTFAFRAAACLSLIVLVACATGAVEDTASDAEAAASRDTTEDVAVAPASNPAPADDRSPSEAAIAPTTADVLATSIEPAPAPKPRVATSVKPAAPAMGAKPAPSPAPPQKPAPEPAPPSTAIVGQLELVAGNGQEVAAGEVADGLVYFLPKAGNPRPKAGHFTINTHSKGFRPSLLVVPVGSTISFPNKDTILHNVFSKTPGTTFDFGFYGPGETKRQVFSKPGLVIVNCNVHHNMRANVVVLETPYYARPGKSGKFRIKDVPPGPGTLVFWHPRSKAQTVPVKSVTDPVVRRLTAVKPRLETHAASTR